MVAVAIGQHVAARTARLTPWRGGGFGMFATVDSPRMRICRVYLLSADGIEWRGRVPLKHERQWLQVQAMPTPERVVALAEVMAEETWVPEDFDPFGVFEPGRVGSSRKDDPSTQYRAAETGEPKPSADQAQSFSRLRLEVLKCHYERVSGRVTATSLEVATVLIR